MVREMIHLTGTLPERERPVNLAQRRCWVPTKWDPSQDHYLTCGTRRDLRPKTIQTLFNGWVDEPHLHLRLCVLAGAIRPGRKEPDEATTIGQIPVASIPIQCSNGADEGPTVPPDRRLLSL